MKQLFYFLTVLLFSSLFISSCTIDVGSEDPIIVESDISNYPAEASLGEGNTFSIETVLFEKTTLFGDRGYNFHFYDDVHDCSSSLSAPISFFIEYSGELKTGKYDGTGPFFHFDNGSTSFLGCDVVITEVTDTMIEGKVKGGDDEQYINGTFTAFICE